MLKQEQSHNVSFYSSPLKCRVERSRKYFSPPPLIADQWVTLLSPFFRIFIHFCLFYCYGGVFWRPTFTLLFNLFRFSTFCYDLEIIDLITLIIIIIIQFLPSQPLEVSYSRKARVKGLLS